MEDIILQMSGGLGSDVHGDCLHGRGKNLGHRRVDLERSTCFSPPSMGQIHISVIT